MRSVELLLWFANLLAFLILALPLPHTVRRTRYPALTALFIAAAQVLVEGPRWQMIPAYVLSASFFPVGLLKDRRSAGVAVGSKPTKRSVAVLGAGLGALVLALSGALPAIFPVFRFPRPRGPYEIGTLTYHWVDANRLETFTVDPNDYRELMVQIWYPAGANGSTPRAHYVQDGSILAPLARLLQLPEFLFTHLRYGTTNAILSAPVAEDNEAYPVLLFSHGRGGFRQQNTLQVEELVSHGYIVAAVDHPYVASTVIFPDGRRISFDPRMRDRTFIDGMISYLAQDVIFTLDRLAALNEADPNGILTGRIDLQRVGIFGLSLGGAVSAEACHLDSRFRACLAMDEYMPADVVEAGLQQPTMWLSRDAETMQLEGWDRAFIDRTQASMRAVFESLPGDGYLVLTPGMFHLNFSDTRLFFWPPLASRLGFLGPIDAQRATNIVNDFSLAFFDRHLKSRPAPLLDSAAEQYPEVLFTTRRP